MNNVYPKGSWNVRIKADINTFLDAYISVLNTGGNYGDVARIIGCEIIDVQFAEVRIRNSGVNLPRLNFNELNDDRVVMLM